MEDAWVHAESLESPQRRESLLESVDFDLTGFTMQVEWAQWWGKNFGPCNRE